MRDGGIGMNKKYIVRLTDDERQKLIHLTKTGKAAAYKIKHAHILLQVDANGPNWSDDHVAQAFRCHGNTVRNTRQRYVEHGLEAALRRKQQVRPSRQRLLDGAKEARLIALRCSQPPTGTAKWTLKLLADTLVTLNVVETISYETVRQTLKKTRSSRTCTSAG
jgi:transposase